MSLFGGIEIGRRALLAQQQAMMIVGQNAANASTRGYTRQDVQLEAAAHLSSRGLGLREVGSGVEVADIRRLRDDFLDRQFRMENGRLSQWQTMDTAFTEIEGIFSEPGDSGLQSQMELFWQSWQELANNPESIPARETVIEQGTTLIDAFQHVDRQLQGMQDNLSASLRASVEEVNQTARQLVDLNRQIRSARAAGADANNLADRRDLLLDDLSALATIQVSEDEAGNLRVTVGGITLVDGDNLHLWETDASGSIVWSDSGLAVAAGEGKVTALMELRDTVVQGYREALNALVFDLAEQVNLIHQGGYGLDGGTGRPFFSGVAAGDLYALAVDPAVAADPRMVAASATGAEGDGSNALDIYRVRHWQAVPGGGSIDDRYITMIAGLGTDSRGAQRLAENQRLLVTQVDNQRQQVSGVSLDEEVTRMIQFQQAYQAAARFITALDEMIGTIIQRTGMVGR